MPRVKVNGNIVKSSERRRIQSNIQEANAQSRGNHNPSPMQHKAKYKVVGGKMMQSTDDGRLTKAFSSNSSSIAETWGNSLPPFPRLPRNDQSQASSSTAAKPNTPKQKRRPPTGWSDQDARRCRQQKQRQHKKKEEERPTNVYDFPTTATVSQHANGPSHGPSPNLVSTTAGGSQNRNGQTKANGTNEDEDRVPVPLVEQNTFSASASSASSDNNKESPNNHQKKRKNKGTSPPAKKRRLTPDVDHNYKTVCAKAASPKKNEKLGNELEEKVLCPVEDRPTDWCKQVFPSPDDRQVVLAICHVLTEGIAFNKKKEEQNKETTTPGLIYADQAGVGKTSIVWMVLSQLKLKGIIKSDAPALIVASNGGGSSSILKHWGEEFKLCQVGPGKDSSHQLTMEVVNDFGNVPDADVYLMSENKFTSDGNGKMQKWMAAANIQLVILDEAHGVGNRRSSLRLRVDNLYKELPNVQLLLISANTEWTEQKLKYFKAAIGLSKNMQLQKRIIQRPVALGSATSLLPPETERVFSTIHFTTAEKARLAEFTVSQSNPSESDVANTVAFEEQAKLLAQMILNTDENERWSIWAITNEDKVKLRDYLETQNIKCSVIADMGNIDKYGSQVEDNDCQVVFPPKIHERGVNIYKDIPNVVLFYEHLKQSRDNDLRRQVIGRHKRRCSKHTKVNVWHFDYAKSHPYRDVSRRYIEIHQGASIGDDSEGDQAVVPVQESLSTQVPIAAEECDSDDDEVPIDIDGGDPSPNNISKEAKHQSPREEETTDLKSNGSVATNSSYFNGESKNQTLESHLKEIADLKDDLEESGTESMMMDALEERFEYTVGVAAQLQEIGYLKDLKTRGIISHDQFQQLSQRIIRNKP